jgi:hypothetical protein
MSCQNRWKRREIERERAKGDRDEAKKRYMLPMEIRTEGRRQDKETEEEKDEQTSPRTFA